MTREFRRPGKVDNRVRGAHHLVSELACQKNGRFRNPKIRRPFFGFVHATQQRGVFLWREVSVKPGTKLRIHLDRDGSPSRPTYFSRFSSERASEIKFTNAPLRLRSVQAPVRPYL